MAHLMAPFRPALLAGSWRLGVEKNTFAVFGSLPYNLNGLYRIYYGLLEYEWI
jgi:hypothetical protein